MEKSQLIGRGRTAEIYVHGQNTVLKLFYSEFSQQTILKEIQINQELVKNGLSVPKVFDLVESEGRHGFIMERVNGVSMLHVLAKKPWSILKYGSMLGELHASMHHTTITGLDSLKSTLARNIDHQKLLTGDKKTQIQAHLHNLPEGNILCHGDFHPDNVLLSAQGPVIIDWINASVGHPLADVARTSLLLLNGDPPDDTAFKKVIQTGGKLFYRSYIRTYLQLTGVSREEIQSWTLPIASARLNEGIPALEKQRLLHLIDQLLMEMV